MPCCGTHRTLTPTLSLAPHASLICTPVTRCDPRTPSSTVLLYPHWRLWVQGMACTVTQNMHDGQATTPHPTCLHTILNVHSVPSLCLCCHSACTVHPTVPPRCLHDAFTVPPLCFHSVHTTPTRCASTVHPLCLQCASTVHPPCLNFLCPPPMPGQF